MKYFLIIIGILGLITLNGCEVSEEGLRVSYEVVEVDSVQMPAAFEFGETYNIPVFYKRRSTCNLFEGFDVSPELNVRNISVVLARLDAGSCEEIMVTEEQTLSFTAASNGSYIFRFFNGFDADNELTYLEFEVPVLE